MNIKKYETEVKNFYLFISHKKNGKANVSYGYFYNKYNMIEFEPYEGPFTFLNCTLEEYLTDFDKIDRGIWKQTEFDNSFVKLYLQDDNFERLVSELKRYI